MSRRQSFAASFSKGCAVEFIVLILIIGFLALVLSRDKGQTNPGGPPPPAPTANSGSGTSPLPPSSGTSIPPPGTPSFNCWPGIEVGKTVNIMHRAVRMRHSPGYVEKDDRTDTKHYMETGDRVVIKSGPQMKDGLCWWLVEHDGLQGWTADHSREGRLLLSAGQ